MSSVRFALALAIFMASRCAAAAAPPPLPSEATPAIAEDARETPAPRPRELALRFAWPRSLEARVTYRRVVVPPGAPERIFTARYTERATHVGDELRIVSSGTRWDGEIPYPPDEIRTAMRASEAVVQRIGADGAFAGLLNGDALRPVLQRIYGAEGVSDEETEQAISEVEAAMVDEARDGWNLAVGFWVGAELDFGKAWEKEVDAPVWLLPALAVKSRVRMEARRRVPCTASERKARCVELLLHSEPDRAGLVSLTRAIVGKLAGDQKTLPPGEVLEVGLASDLTLVTEPDTLVPYRVVWRRAVRATLVDDEGPRELEDVERTEWSWSYVRRGAPSVR